MGQSVNAKLWPHLVLPLLVTSGVSIAIHRHWPVDGFFLNLATALLGILITIWYVDWILRRHERLRWLPADKRIADRLRILLNATISGLRSGLGFGTDVLNLDLVSSSNTLAMHKDVMRIAEHVIAPAALSRISAIDQAGWSSLARHVQNSHNGTLAFLNAFQVRLDPVQISDLLDMQESLLNSLTYYSTFPDIMGVPDHLLPPSKTPPEILRQFGCESAAKELRNVCALARKLSNSVD